MESYSHHAFFQNINLVSVFEPTRPISQGSPPAVSQSTNWIGCESTQTEFTFKFVNLVRDWFSISAYSVGIHV